MPEFPLPPRVISREDFARRLGVSKKTLYRKERRGELPPKRAISPGRVGWLEQEVNAHIEGLPVSP